jgi:rhodanese-related sulfurtransferase
MSSIAKMIKDGATIIDVRSMAEYEQGHFSGSLNIPVQQLEASLHKIDSSKTILVCCASGGRSEMAKVLMNARGFDDVINVGAWQNLDS